jgi:hypothetical protein
MPLTSEDRKKLLGHGGLSRIARRLDCTLGHISEVNRTGRPDKRARAAIAREIIRKNPQLTFADIWPEAGATTVAA